MPRTFFTRDIKISRRKLFAVITLFSTTLAGFYIFYAYVLNLMTKQPGIDPYYSFVAKMLFLSVAVISGLIGSIVIERVDQRKFLWCWLIFGFFTTLFLGAYVSLEFSLLLTILMGISFGLGFPTCQAFLTESTVIEERGRISGLAILIAFSIVVVAFVFAEAFFGLFLILFSLKGISFLALLLDPSVRGSGPTIGWAEVIKFRGFISFAFPWLIFHLANGLLVFGVLPSGFEDVVSYGSVINFLGTIITAIIAGLVADRFGRKQPLLVGLIMLGISYAFFGLAASQFSYLVYLIVEGIAWGLIAVTYMQVILGDLSSKLGSKERFYALGGLMIPLLTYEVFALVQEWSKFTVPANTLSSILSIAVILSVIPVFLASETLPSAKLRQRKLKEHIEKVGKIIEESKENK